MKIKLLSLENCVTDGDRVIGDVKLHDQERHQAENFPIHSENDLEMSDDGYLFKLIGETKVDDDFASSSRREMQFSSKHITYARDFENQRIEKKKARIAGFVTSFVLTCVISALPDDVADDFLSFSSSEFDILSAFSVDLSRGVCSPSEDGVCVRSGDFFACFVPTTGAFGDILAASITS
ncbi:unnamed protein product [Haemonchus placei]|uniref:Uncharacterized protein n=1 Tax=Haemonchus placei TaxID=6290 RepID=A0A0N4W218_HAEPC|nr:unnamed protein product [Haemonchus placei]